MSLRTLLHQFTFASTFVALCICVFDVVWAGEPATAVASPPALTPEGIPIADIVDAGEFSIAKLSPDGKHVVIIGTFGYLVDTATLDTKFVSNWGSAREGNYVYSNRAQNVVWVTNEIFVVDYGVRSVALTIKGDRTFDVGRSVIGKAEPGNFESPWIYATLDSGSRTIAKVNTATAEFIKIKLPVDGEPFHFVFDAKGLLRALMVKDASFWSDETKISNWYKSGGDAPWEKLGEFKITDNYWEPIFAPAEENTLYISTSQGRDTKAVFSYDTKKRAIGEMLAGHPAQDIIYAGGLDQGNFRGVMTLGMKPQFYWFEPAWGSAQKAIDVALPNRINLISGDPGNKLLVQSFSDTSPATLHLFDAAKRSIAQLKIQSPKFDVAKMRPMEVLSYAAKDGLNVSAYLTRPANVAKPMPTVVLIHGGPWIRDHWGWDSEVQILASRGYVVFQPQFRGSTGFGDKFREAGYRQWGLAMQDDITAGVEHLIKNGVADPDRICIVGSSYGGYAALWGLVKTPNLYRCGVSFAGVADIEFMFNDSSDKNDSKAARELMRWRVGDSKLSKAQFDNVSPLKNANRISAPVLLMHGAEDKRVPISHSKKMIEALEQAGKSYEWHSFVDEGHGFRYLRSRILYHEKILTFLGKHLGPTATLKK